MCGLVGIAGKLEYKDEFTMKRLLLADYFRGPDSTGFAAIRQNGDAKIAKIASNPIDLFDMQTFKTALNGNQSRAFMGHNRFATRGGVTSANAHPYQFDHIIGAHNGTLDKASVTALQDKLGEEYTVDSQALFASIAKFGIDKTIKMCYHGKTSNEGAWAIVWYDQNEGSLNFLRNEHRPLYFAYERPKDDGTDGFQRIFWASEYWMIREAIASSVAGYRLYKRPETTVGFFPFDPDTHYKYDLAALVEGSKTPPKPKVKVLKGKEVPITSVVPFSTAGAGSASWPVKTDGTRTGSVMNPKSQPNKGGFTTHTKTTGDKSKKPKLITMDVSSSSPYGDFIDETKFSYDYGAKCFWCGEKLAYGAGGLSFYQQDKTILCSPCSGNVNHEHPVSRIYVNSSVIDSLCV